MPKAAAPLGARGVLLRTTLRQKATGVAKHKRSAAPGQAPSRWGAHACFASWRSCPALSAHSPAGSAPAALFAPRLRCKHRPRRRASPRSARSFAFVRASVFRQGLRKRLRRPCLSLRRSLALSLRLRPSQVTACRPHRYRVRPSARLCTGSASPHAGPPCPPAPFALRSGGLLPSSQPGA